MSDPNLYRYRSHAIKLLAAVQLLLLLLLSGCFPKYIDYGMRYRLDEIGPDGLAAWAMEQTDAREVSTTLYVLASHSLVNSRSDPKALMEGYKAIMRRLEAGWPGLQANNMTVAPGQDIRERLLEIGYGCLARISNHEIAPPELRQTYLELRPPTSRQPQYDYWIRNAREYGISGE